MIAIKECKSKNIRSKKNIYMYDKSVSQQNKIITRKPKNRHYIEQYKYYENSDKIKTNVIKFEYIKFDRN